MSHSRGTAILKALLFIPACLAAFAVSIGRPAPVPAAELRVVGVLGNTAGTGQPAVPYAFYTGIAIDAHERLWLAGGRTSPGGSTTRAIG